MAELQTEGPAAREESRDPASHLPPVWVFSCANSAWSQALSGQNRRKSMLFELSMIFIIICN